MGMERLAAARERACVFWVTFRERSVTRREDLIFIE